MFLFFFTAYQDAFATLRDNLFSSGHIFSDSKSSFASLLMVEIEFEGKEILVSSACILTIEALSLRRKS